VFHQVAAVFCAHFVRARFPARTIAVIHFVHLTAGDLAFIRTWWICRGRGRRKRGRGRQRRRRTRHAICVPQYRTIVVVFHQVAAVFCAHFVRARFPARTIAVIHIVHLTGGDLASIRTWWICRVRGSRRTRHAICVPQYRTIVVVFHQVAAVFCAHFVRARFPARTIAVIHFVH
jgi:hypothetical protein